METPKVGIREFREKLANYLLERRAGRDYAPRGYRVQMDGESNHVHLLVNYPPKVSVSSLVNSLKGVSSYVLRRQLPRIAKCYWKNVLWSPSYFAASCGGAPLEVIKRYIEEQATPL